MQRPEMGLERGLKFTARERAAYLLGYQHAHRDRLADLHRLEGDFQVEMEKLKGEISALRSWLAALTGRSPPLSEDEKDRPPPAIN